MPRLLAALLLTLAAFAWAPPFLDRAGTAALGLAFLALAMPRPPRKRRLPGLTPAALGLTLPTQDAGKTTPNLSTPLDPLPGAFGHEGEPDTPGEMREPRHADIF